MSAIMPARGRRGFGRRLAGSRLLFSARYDVPKRSGRHRSDWLDQQTGSATGRRQFRRRAVGGRSRLCARDRRGSAGARRSGLQRAVAESADRRWRQHHADRHLLRRQRFNVPRFPRKLCARTAAVLAARPSLPLRKWRVGSQKPEAAQAQLTADRRCAAQPVLHCESIAKVPH